MFRTISYLLVISLFIISFTACVSEKDKEDMRKMLKDSYSSSSNSSASSSSGNASQSSSSSSTKPESNASTAVDNKPPKSNNKDGITIHIPQSDLDEISQALKDASEYISNYELPEYDVPSFNSRDDIVLDVPDDWDKDYSGGINSEGWDWQSKE